jgi:hypothetical protein
VKKKTMERDYDDWLMIAATGGIDWENNPPPEELRSEELCIADVQDATPEHLGKMPEPLRTEAVCRAAVFIDDAALESFTPAPLREKVRAWKDSITPEEWLDELTYWYNPNHYLKLPQKLLTPDFLREMVARNKDTISLVPEELVTEELRALAKTGGDRFEQFIKRLKDGAGAPQPLSASGTAMVMENAMRPKSGNDDD